jgi:OmcA/MtrC family decaheme c-type cytochrome
MSTKKFKAIALSFNFFFIMIISLSCGGNGDVGAPGTPGAAGAQGELGQNVAAPTSVEKAVINSVSMNEETRKTNINFSLFGPGDVPILTLPEGFTAGSIRFTLAKLTPPTLTGDTNQWKSYISVNRSSSKYDAVPQATYEKASAGSLTHSGNGVWNYQMLSDIFAQTAPINVVFDKSHTHRVGMQFVGNQDNPTYDFRPDGLTITETRSIVAVEDCNKCHGPLALHGGGRLKIEYCATCHNQTTTGVTKSNNHISLDLQSIVHKIHYGKDLPSNVKGATSTGSGNYSIVGYRDSIHNYDNISYPRQPGVQDCTNCHIENTSTPDHGNWKKKPTRESCGSCHDDVNFATGENHGSLSATDAIQADNKSCAVCHTEEKIDAVHTSEARALITAAGKFKYNLISTGNTSPGEKPYVTFSMTDPTNGDLAYDVTLSDNKFNINLGWSTTDYTNTGSSNLPRPISTNSNNAISNGNGTYTVYFTEVIPLTMKGSGVVMFDGHPKAILPGKTSSSSIPVTNVVSYFTITDTTVVSRREVVDNNKCLNCHGSLQLHGNNRNNEVLSCVVCHNPTATDVNRRNTFAGNNIDGKNMESVDFKYMVHAIHAASKRKSDGVPTYVAYGYGNKSHEYGTNEVHFPGSLKDCTTCHLDNTYTLPVSKNALAITGNTMANKTDPTDDLIITPNAAACYSCHATELSKLHMEHNGASFMTTTRQNYEASTPTESCAICHGEGRSADVKTVHSIK